MKRKDENMGSGRKAWRVKGAGSESLSTCLIFQKPLTVVCCNMQAHFMPMGQVLSHKFMILGSHGCECKV